MKVKREGMVAVVEQKNSSTEERHNYRFIPLMDDNIYNCELCGVGIAVLKVMTSTADDQEQFKLCGTCLKEYIDRETEKK